MKNTLVPIQEIKNKILKTYTKKELKIISRKIDTKKISAYTKEEYTQLMKTLLKLAKFMGITEPPDNEVLQMLAEFIAEHYGDFSQEEISDAFIWALNQEDFRHFNRFTPQLLAKVISKYKYHRNTTTIKYRKELEDKVDRYKRKIKVDNLQIEK